MFEVKEGHEMKVNSVGTNYIEDEKGSITSKVCSGCSEMLELTSFSNNKGGLGGKHSRCGDCVNKATRTRYYKEVPEVRTEKARLKNIKFRDRISAYGKKYYQENKETINERVNQHYADNKEHAKSMHKKWREENKDYFAEYIKEYNRIPANIERKKGLNREWYQENKEHKYALQKIWNKENPERRKLQASRRRTLIQALPHTLTLEQTEELMLLQGGKCFVANTSDSLHLEHFIPISWGAGGTTFENCYFMEGTLNYQKGSKNPFEWINSQPEEYQERFYGLLVPELAERNGMTVEEFIYHVYECEQYTKELV